MGFWQRLFGGEKIEKRSSGAGFTSEIVAARAAYIAGRSGLAELTATAQSCISLWENGLALSDVQGAPMLTRNVMALTARSLALRGESVWLIRDDRLVPVSDLDVSTRDGKPVAYRVSIPEAGGGRTETALAGEILHFRIGLDAAAPWSGSSPLRRASLTASMLNAIESALAEVFETAPIGSLIVPMPEIPDQDSTALGRSFRARRGQVLLRESVNVTAAGGATPNQDWRPQDVTPDLEKTVPIQALQAARGSVLSVFGVLPALLSNETTGPLVREAQRHMFQYTLQPVCMLIAEEASEKLGGTVEIDCLRPAQAFDTGGRARALSTIVEALAKAKEAGIDAGTLNNVLSLVNWGENDKAA